MKNRLGSFSFWKEHLLALGLFTLVTIVYCMPILQGKVLVQNDTMQSIAMAKEARDIYEKTGELSLWTNSAFSGMPSYLIFIQFPLSLISNLANILSYTLPIPINMMMVSLISAYILLRVMRYSLWISVFGALAFCFSSFIMISIEAGHVSKILALGYLPLLLAGVLLVRRGEYLLGGSLTAFFVALQVYSSHIQISYYGLLMLAIYFIYELIMTIKSGEWKSYFISVGVLVFAAAIGAGTRATMLIINYEYTKETIRGGSELASNTESKGGLDRDYAFYHSQGIVETFTLLIPNLYGGGSAGSLGEDSETYKTLARNNVGKKDALSFISQLPLYWGDQPFTSGPVYAGAIVLFFAVLALLASTDRNKWWLASAIVIFMLMTWGKNFSILNDVLFDFFPLYNKFRAVTMLNGVIQLLLVLLAVLGLKWAFENLKSLPLFKKKLLLSLYVTAGLCLAFGVLGSTFFDFNGANDSEFKTQLTQMTRSDVFADQILSAIVEDREGMMRMDAFRSLLFILLSAGALYLAALQKIKPNVAAILIASLTLVDLWGVDKRYFNDKNFIKGKDLEKQFVLTDADRQILQDPDPHYRVFNTIGNAFSNAYPSYFHKSIGGYHGAKLRRYQELIERQISKNNRSVFNMLNTKYFIVRDNEGNAQVMPNPEACGNAWLVQNIKWADSPDEELEMLSDFDPKSTAIIDKKWESYLKLSDFSNAQGSIQLTEYKPNMLTYRVSAPKGGFAVFSEIFYRGNQDWISKIDGQEANHVRVNYVLRGMEVPAGEHTITFSFDPPSFQTGQKIDLITSILVFLGLGIAIVMYLRPKSTKESS